MKPILFWDRTTGTQQVEKVYGAAALKFMYGDDWITLLFGAPLLHTLFRFPFFSVLYGWWQKTRWSRKKIQPFIAHFQVDTSEFLEPVDQFQSFNDFFIRKLKPEVRPIVPNKNVAVMPADGRYRFYPHISGSDGFIVKGEKFCLASFLGDANLASQYEHGAMVMARLCPTDYHRFHFPCDGIPGETHWINGWLYSVNPIALKKDIAIFTKNKRAICELQTERFGKVVYVEVGATSVGTVVETYTPHQPYSKGAEKGYFSFGASMLVLLFEPGRITFDADLLAYPDQEIRCLMGQQLGRVAKLASQPKI